MVNEATLLCTDPPIGRWTELNPAEDRAGGYLFVYYSDDISRSAVRFVTKPGDNKADPNLETCSFGLFSTCGRSMRSGLVRRSYPYVFFLTRKRQERVLAGYYRFRWYADGVFANIGDPCLAADRIHFVDPPLSCSKLGSVNGLDLSAPFRGCKLVTPSQCRAMVRLLEKHADATPLYLAEIDRLERLNLKYGGFRYIAWRQEESFTWATAKKYIAARRHADRQAGRTNTSPTGRWRCVACEYKFANVSLLKRCPSCGALGSLRPA